ncbi:MAG TPA: 2-phospho-L-lactate guanylyltransferase [Stellaceae bacterium]|nr:2-phospho-L-lactate guanylyltransferase [Stellaceae bacterium]
MTGRGIWAVVPAKDLSAAKQRLAGLLSLAERQALACAMLEDVLGALAAVPGLAGLLVVTRDAELAATARRLDARLMTDLRHDGPTAAVTAAAAQLAAAGAEGMLAVPADIPLASAAEFAEVLTAMRPAPSVTLAPALADMGSNAVALAPVGAIPLAFGTRSFFRHQEAALRRGIEPLILRLPGIGLDLDRPEDIAAFLTRPSPARSYVFLQDCGVAARLAKARLAAPGHAS